VWVLSETWVCFTAPVAMVFWLRRESEKMLALSPIFQNFWLPNATTWFYFSLLLAVALFFKFSRLLSMRNWDVFAVFVLMPGVLLIEDAQPSLAQKRVAAATLIANASGNALASPVTGITGTAALAPSGDLVPKPWLKLGYAWLLIGSGYFLVRCLLDLVLVQRPALAPNLNFAGLAWLAGTLFVCLTAVAFRPDDGRSQGGPTPQLNGPNENDTDKVGRESAALELGQRSLEGWGRRTMAVVCHLIVAIGLIVMGKVHFQDALAGMGAATCYLMLPYTGHYVPYLLHVWPMALIVWALVAYRSPVVAGVLLGLAAGTIYFPVLLFPLWLSFYWGRGAGRFTLAFAGTTVVVLGITGMILLWSDDLGRSITEAISSSDWQPWKVPTTEGIWQGIHWAYRIPVFVVFLALVGMTAFWPMPKNLGHVIALSAAVLIGVQFWYADKGGQYVLWYLPLLLLLMFRPNLSDRRPLPIAAETDWVRRVRQPVSAVIAWLFRSPDPLLRVR
jgi:hypothetical protein